jgi:Ca-activated chloride channel homolog
MTPIPDPSTSFQFASPLLLGLLVIVALLAARSLLSRSGNSSGGEGSKQSARLAPAPSRGPATITHSATSLARDLPRSWRVAMRPALTAMRLLAVALIVVALARPQIVQGKETIKGEGVDIALALDISGSMGSLDFQPQNRLQAAKQVIDEFIGKRPYDKIGLVVFASEAFRQAPLTLDRNALGRSLDQVGLATDLGLDDATAIGLGIANAANMLAQSSAKSKIIILLTDGVHNAGEIDPLTAAEAAKALGIKVYAVGAAKPGQVPVPVTDVFGNSQIAYQESEIDEGTLRQVADITGGKYYRAEDTRGLKAIYDAIDKLEKSQVEVQVFNQYQELAGWLMVPALLLLLAQLVLSQTIFRVLP